ncbi:hypothetical protein F4859DRAFT_514382 [Xylaria cf. heliscus]|nr:hypothetical protein F4859DRAFT_514382 [Xylaria cf. heliscus]
MPVEQDPVAELRQAASNLISRMNWLVERIDRDSQGNETQAAKKKMRLFDTICESMSTTSTRWENLVNSLYAEFEVNQQQLTIARARIEEERIELEASRQRLTKSRSRYDGDVEELRRARQRFDDEWKIKARSQLTSDKLERSLNTLHISNERILGELANQAQKENHNEETAQLRQAYDEAQDKIQEREIELYSVEDKLINKSTELQKVQSGLADAKKRISKREGEFWALQDQIAVTSSALQQEMEGRRAIQHRLEELQSEFETIQGDRGEEKKSHEETKGLVSRLKLQLETARQDLEKVLTERDKLKNSLAETENNLTGSEEKVRQLELAGKSGPKRRRDTSMSTSEDVDVFDELDLPHGKRARVDVTPILDTPHTRWYNKVEDMKSLFYKFRLICSPEANLSLGDALAEFLRASDDGLDDPLSDFVSEAPEGTWYCFEQISEHCFGSDDALIEGDECYVHKDKCFQISNASKTEGYGSIYCRLKEYS